MRQRPPRGLTRADLASEGSRADRLRIALVFDTIFPATRGGAERWFTALADELSGLGHEVTYVTSRRDGPRTQDQRFSVVEVSRGGPLYATSGGRRLLPSVTFGLAVGRFLRRHRHAFDAVYVHQTPLFSVLATRLALGRSLPWAVEWIEWWSREYWRRYAPGPVGLAGWWVQRAALACTPMATVFAESTRTRIERLRPALRVERMPGQVLDRQAHRSRDAASDVPLVLFVGRLVPEKHPEAFLDAVEELARRRPVRGLMVGDGPLLARLRRRAEAVRGVQIDVVGGLGQSALDEAFGAAAVLLHPSEREGFGLVVVEAAAWGVPTVLVAGADNAAVELVAEGRNGHVARDRTAGSLADAVEGVLSQGAGLRARTGAWFVAEAPERSVVRSAASLVRLFTSPDLDAGRQGSSTGPR